VFRISPSAQQQIQSTGTDNVTAMIVTFGVDTCENPSARYAAREAADTATKGAYRLLTLLHVAQPALISLSVRLFSDFPEDAGDRGPVRHDGIFRCNATHIFC
jgi:hypothetical protein